MDEDPEVGFDVLPPAALGKSIADTMLAGGYRGRYRGTEQDAAQLVDDYLAEVQFNTGSWQVRRSFASWSEWFGAVVWDATWLLLDPRTNRVLVLAKTDTD